MQHTPYGYDIIGGRAVINEEQTANIREMCKNYLSGMSFKNAAAAVGLNMSHCGVKRMMLNARYLGDEFYPAILTEETVRQVEAERTRREKALGRDRRKGKGAPKGVYYTGFSAPKITMKYKDPVAQAEYAYSRIRNEVSG
jgi:hypothetical protein